MSEVREIPEGRTELAAPALLALRPRWSGPAELVEQIDARLRPAGYRLIGLFEDGTPAAQAVAGFRICDALAWGRYLYLDDLSTLPAHRGRGHADRLLDEVFAEAERQGCESVHLDSVVGPDRAPAHRLYLRRHLRISAHHFHREL